MLKSISSYAEAILQSAFAPLKPHMSKIGKFLLVSTFIEDSFRIAVQWGDQVDYMQYYRGFPWIVSIMFLSAVVLSMSFCSLTVLFSRTYLKYASYGLMSVIALQAIGYGLLTDFTFVLRNLSLCGGLALLMAQTESQERQRKAVFGGLPIGPDSKSMIYLPLLGRILLLLLFLSLLFAGEMTPLMVLVGALGLISCTMVIVGFKAKTSAALLLAILSVSNIILNNWWSLHDGHPQRDYVKYDFFQTLSIMGGFLLLIEHGPGTISIDDRKKPYE